MDRFNINGKQAAEKYRMSQQSSSNTKKESNGEAIPDAYDIRLDIDATLTQTLQALATHKSGISTTESLSEGVWRAQISRNTKKVIYI